MSSPARVAEDGGFVALRDLDRPDGFAPFGRAETGWDIYAPFVGRTIGTDCPAGSEAFAQRLAAWQAAHGLAADGNLTEAGFGVMKDEAQGRRPFVAALAAGGCPETADVIAQAQPAEGTGGKTVWLRPAALTAYRAMTAAARAEIPELIPAW